LAGVGTGVYHSVPEACAATVRIVDRTEPLAANQAAYNEYYPIYRSLYRSLKPAFDAVAAIESHGDSNWGAVLSEEQITDIAEAAAEEVGTLTAQEVRDAMKLAPTAGSPAAGSVDKHLDDIQTKTDNIGTATIVVSTPLSVDGSTLYLTRGDSYTATAGRAIEFTYSGSADIAGATATLSVRTYDDSLEMTVKGTIDGDTITFEPTATDTADLTETHLPRKHKYDYELVLADGTTHITPVVGNCIVTMDKSR